jgi:hypothetical protein
MTITTLWNDYVAQVFPEGMPDLQRKELRRAFFAGALSSFLEVEKASSQLEEEAAVRAVASIYCEIEGELRAMAQTCKDRN